MRRSPLWVILVTATVGLTGCTAARPSPEPPAPRPAAPMALAAFDSCADLQHDLRAAAQNSVGAWGFNGTYPSDVMAIPDARTIAAVPATPAFSSTNAHELGADEPDLVKTDGRRIVTLSEGTLYVVDAATRKLTGKLAIGGDGQVLLSGDHALVLLTAAVMQYRWLPGHPIGGTTNIVLVDLTGPPRIISRYEGRGDLLDARQTGSVARVVMHTTPRITFPGAKPGTSESAMIKANRAAIGQAGIDAWLPSWSVTTTGATSTGTTSTGTTSTGAVPCGSVSRPAVYSGSGILSVLTFDLAAPALTGGDPIGIVADGNTFYSTGSSLYVAGDERWRGDGHDTTDIYRFSTDGSAAPRFRAAGRVSGHPVDQYALSEWDGRLRVATTGAKDSAVRVLEQHGTTLNQVGVVGGLGRGEQIQSVQYVGPRGYVVTFRQLDPLYTLDLSDAAHPRVAGELTMTGYSSHLQPIGDDRLIGIGQDATTAGQSTGTQVSLFDVSDPAAPKRLARYSIPGGWSEAEFQPHALLWWPATRTLAVPVNQSGLVLKVGDTDLTRAGTMSGAVRRNLVVGDVLWSVTDTGLQASNLSTLARLATVRF